MHVVLVTVAAVTFMVVAGVIVAGVIVVGVIVAGRARREQRGPLVQRAGVDQAPGAGGAL